MTAETAIAYPVRLLESGPAAGAHAASVFARRIRENNLSGVAAIAGKQVAERYGLKILDSNIQDIKENQTRFVLFGKRGSNLNRKTSARTLQTQFDMQPDWSPKLSYLQSFHARQVFLDMLKTSYDGNNIFEEFNPLAFSARLNEETTPNWNQAMNGPDALGFWEAMIACRKIPFLLSSVCCSCLSAI